MTGIIHSIMRFVESWLGDADGVMLIFCIRNIEIPTATGRTRFAGMGYALEFWAKLTPRKLFESGMTSCTIGEAQEYRNRDRSARLSGVVGRVLMMAWYRPIHIGNWMSTGPRQPSGLNPASR